MSSEENITISPEESRISGVPKEFPADKASFYRLLVTAAVERKQSMLPRLSGDALALVGRHLEVLVPLDQRLGAIAAEQEAQVAAGVEAYLREITDGPR